MRWRLYLWVFCCWVCIILGTTAELFSLGWALYYLRYLGGEPAGVLPLFFQNLTIIAFLGWFGRAKAREAYQDEMLKQQGDTMVARRLTLLQKILQELCDKRSHPVPDVLFIRSGRANDRIMVGMLDNMLVNDVLCLHPDVVGILTEAQMRAVLAHELRHSNAWENFITRICRGIRGAFFLTGAWLVLMSIVSGVHWWSAFLSVPIFVLVLCFGFILANFRSRYTEYKTDALSTLESKDPESLISALGMVWRVLSVEFSFLKDRQDAWWISIFNTHPANSARARALRWIHR